MTDPATLALELRREYADLETVDIPAVEVLSTGGPIFGVGSPKGGDFYTREDLERMADANRALAAELEPPMKIGHSDAQTLLQNSDLPVPTPGEMPAVGWLDGSTARVVDEPDGLSKLVMDAKKVPKVFSQLLNVGAYRKRSSELETTALGEVSSVTSQVTGKTYDWVVTGLAWLGAKLPAVRTLDDVVKLYAEAGLDVPPQLKFRAFAVAQAAVVWEPSASFQALRDDVSQALNGGPTGGMIEPRFWVQDISVTGDRALAHDYYGGDSAGYVIPFTRAVDGTVTIAPSSDWTSVEEGWVAAAKEYETKNLSPAESSPMADVTLTDEQLAALREKLGVEGDEVTADQLVEAADARANELADAKTKADEAEQRKLEADEAGGKVADLEKRLAATERRAFEMERDGAIGAAIKDGRVTPADKAKWEKRYESNAELTKELLSELKPDEDLRREFGSDGHGGDEGDAMMREYEAEIARNAGVTTEQLI